MSVVSGIRWLAPDRPGYGFTSSLRQGEDVTEQGRWTAALLDTLAVPRVHVVAHSIAAGVALALARLVSDRIAGLTFIAPFCRPTRPRLMPGLRLAVSPWVGGVVRRRLLPWLARRQLAAIGRPETLPWLARFPIAHVTRPKALFTAAAELRSFNFNAKALEGDQIHIPALAIVGTADRTAPPGWHLPWLRAQIPGLQVLTLADVGHAPHHTAYRQVGDAVRAHVIAAHGARATSAPRGRDSAKAGRPSPE